MAPLLAVAAEKMEFAGLLRRGRFQSFHAGLQFAAQGAVSGRPWILAAHGPGPHLALRAFHAITRLVTPSALLSTGFCGALQPQLRLHDIVCASSIHVPAADRRYPCALPALPRPCPTGEFVSQNRVASSSAEKAALAATGALAVEMEAAALAAAAHRRALPFFCIRVVTDLAQETFRLDWNALRRDDGRFDTFRILTRALAGPRTTLPELLRLAGRARRAAGALGEFLVDCRF